MSELDALWQHAPCAALQLWHDAGQPQWRLNRAALEWSLQVGLAEPDWQRAARALAGLGETLDAGVLHAASWALDYRAVALSPGWLLWLTPRERFAAGPRSGWRDAQDKLALVQGFGRMGFFERAIGGGRDWWDEHMFVLLGLPPALQPPPFEQAAQRVHPDDRERLIEHHRRSMQRAGRYEVRYRVVLPDGRPRDLHALTEVRNGADGRPETMLGVLIDDTDSAERVRAQQAVSAELARALELAMVSVWRVDLPRRRIHYNEVGRRTAGLPHRPEGVDLDVVRALAHPDDLPAVLRAAEQAIAGDGVVDVEARYRNADGSWRHLLTRRVAERDASGRAVALAGVSLDQTEQIAARAREQALAQRIRLVSDAAGVGVWSIEEGADGEPAKVEWNAQMRRICGWAPGQPAPSLQQWLNQVVHPDDRQRVLSEALLTRRAGGSDVESEFRIVCPDGAVRWVMCRSHFGRRDGCPVHQGIYLDLTQQRALQAQLRLHEHRLKLATEIAGVGIWDRDLDTGTVIWEEQMYRLRGLRPDDPRTPRQIDTALLSPQVLAERRRRIERHLADGQPYEFEFELRWPDGSSHWLASTGHALRDADGKAVRMVGLNWDVTQRKVAEAALRDAEAAERASLAKSQFLARMSHELRTPLNAMLGFAQLLEHDAQGRAQGRAQDRTDGQAAALQCERLQRIRSAGTHLLALIDEVLDLSAVEAGALPLALQPVALHEAVDEVRHWLQPLAAEHGLTLHVAPDDAHVLADARRLRQVLSNLISNAIKYNRRGGSVSLRTLRRVVDGVPGWQLAVRDTGRGFSAEQQAHLYEPFNRLGAERDGIEGRGIGLVTVHHLVRAMGGRLQLQSTPGAGSEFRVWLPQAPLACHGNDAPQRAADGSTGAVASANGAVPAAACMSVLYVEDNAVNVLVMRELFALRPAIALHVAADGGSGLEAARRLRPELVLVDLQLPDMDGFELLRRLREQALPLVAIALSANAMPEAMAQARAAGFDDYWTKPIDLARLLAGLDRLVATRGVGTAGAGCR